MGINLEPFTTFLLPNGGDCIRDLHLHHLPNLLLLLLLPQQKKKEKGCGQSAVVVFSLSPSLLTLGPRAEKGMVDRRPQRGRRDEFADDTFLDERLIRGKHFGPGAKRISVFDSALAVFPSSLRHLVTGRATFGPPNAKGPSHSQRERE